MAAEPGWLRAWADASAVLLLLEVCFALLIVTALVFLLAFGARWLRLHVAPLLNAATPRAREALRRAEASTERVVRGVAEVYGLRQAVEAGARALWRGLVADALAQAGPAGTDEAGSAAATSLSPQAGSPTGGEESGVRTPEAPPASAATAASSPAERMSAHAG
jgi:hypothetical protein